MRFILTILIIFFLGVSQASSILVPMDESQKNHLKSYGLAFWVLQKNSEVEWLLNYRGGSFIMAQTAAVETECKIRGNKL